MVKEPRETSSFYENSAPKDKKTQMFTLSFQKCWRVLPDPGTMLITPGGKPALTTSSANLRAVRGVTWAGLRTTVFPAARQEAIFQANIING